ncbi:hypothetical protein [Haloactinospora alba]|nr:hypothetical protein [Haloactinospora alba]
MLRAAHTLLSVREPLDAEVGVSEMLGAWWARKMPGVDVERRLGEGLVAHAADSGTPAGLALLSGISVLGTSQRQRRLAAESARSLRAQGVSGPSWTTSVGEVLPQSAYISGTRYGDTDEVICVFRYAPTAGTDAAHHALIAAIDHNSGGVLRDAWVTAKPQQLIERCEEQKNRDPMSVFAATRPERARTLLENAIQRTDQVLGGKPENPVRSVGISEQDLAGGSLAAHHALTRARVRSLPREAEPPAEPVWRPDHRAVLAARFLASEEAAELSDSYAASRCVDHIIGYGCDIDAGRPTRVSPSKVETFLLSWLPRRTVLLPEEQEAMPHVLAAWIRWAGARNELPESAVGATLDALWNSTAVFTNTYPDPASSFGLRQEVIRRLLPDGDLAALPRRMFAFPLLTSDLLADSAHEFDPTTREGRRALLKLDHFGHYESPTEHRGKHSAGGRTPSSGETPSEEDLAAHERLAERLWHGDPPALWNAAQRLLDRGCGRSVVLQELLAVLADTDGHDEEELRERLENL